VTIFATKAVSPTGRWESADALPELSACKNVVHWNGKRFPDCRWEGKFEAEFTCLRGGGPGTWNLGGRP
jgi:hypothetical protein